MKIDAAKCISSLPIKNGTSIVTCNKTGNYSTINSYVSNRPELDTFKSKYQDRFDDPSYYYGIGNNTVVGG
jgi:hypothetical protein